MQKTQGVGHMAAALAQHFRQISLRIGEFAYELIEPPGFLDRVEVRTLDILDNGEFEGFLIVGFNQMDRHIVDPGPLRGAPAALPRNDLVEIGHSGNRTHHDGLNETSCADGFSQFLQMIFIEMLAGIARVGPQEFDGDLALVGARRLCGSKIGAGIPDERGQAPAQARAKFVCHDVFPFCQAARSRCSR